jgi:hypothetical protein
MLSKEKAAQIAEELVSQSRAQAADQRDATARHIAFIYRSSALVSLRPARQAEVLWSARQEVRRNWASYPIVLGAAVGVFGLLCWLFGAKPAGAVFPALAISASIGAVARAVLVRAAAARIATKMLQGQVASDASA